MPFARTENITFMEGVRWAVEYLKENPDGKDILVEARKMAHKMYPPYDDFPPGRTGEK